MIDLRYLDVRLFVIDMFRHLVNGCTPKCGCIGLMLFRYLGAIICDVSTIGFVSVCMQESATDESIPDRREPYRRVPLGRVHLDERRLDEVQ